MKNLIDQNGNESNYAAKKTKKGFKVYEEKGVSWSEIDTEKVLDFIYWNDGESIYLLDSDSELFTYNDMSELPEDIDMSDIFTQFSDAEARAIANMLAPNFDTLNYASLNGNTLEIDGDEYLFGTESEMDKLYQQYLDNYIDEIILPEIPTHYHFYFDEDSWKRDAEINGSRGEALSSYDGSELESGDYYLYRTN